MSNPIRSLSKRTLPPLRKPGSYRSSVSSRINVDYELKVTEHLLKNPDYLETFIMQHIELERLKVLMDKIEWEIEPLEKYYSSKKILMENIPNLCSKLDKNRQLNQLQEDDEEFEFKKRTEAYNIMIHEFSQEVTVDSHRLYLCNQKGTSLLEVNSNKEFSLTQSEKCYTCTFAAHNKQGFIQPVVILDKRFCNYGDLKEAEVGSAVVIPIIMHSNNQLIGVLELYRHNDRWSFNKQEENLLNCYSMWTSFLLFYTELFMVKRKQDRLNSFILDVTQKMLGRFTEIDDVVKEIMMSAKSLVNAERATLFLLNKKHQLYGSIFDFGTYGSCKFEKMDKDIRFNIREGIAGYVADTGHTVNISDAYADARFNKKIDSLTGYRTQTMLATPVKVDKKVIGVVQMLNKKGYLFSKEDESELSTFATYCGIALKIGTMYGNLMRSQQKNKITMDVLSHHSCCSKEEYLSFRKREFPTDFTKVQSLEFWPWIVNKDDTVMYVLYMFETLFEGEFFETSTSLMFILAVRNNYRDVSHHNWYHAFSVTQSMYAILQGNDDHFDTIEKLALFVGCLVHDLDNRSKSNPFMIESSSLLSNLYSTSTMEHYHFNMTISILQRSSHNIFQKLSCLEYYDVLSKIRHCILATDLSRYFQLRSSFQVNTNTNVYDFKVNWSDSEMRMKYMGFTMTFCDLSAMFKAWEMQLVLVFTITEELWGQGDEKRNNATKPLMIMDRNQKLELPKLQCEFFDFVCIPCYQLVKYINPKDESVATAVQRALDNRNRWYDLSVMNETDRSSAICNMELATKNFVSDNNINL